MNDSSKDPLLRDLARRHVERERELDAQEQDSGAEWQAASQPLDAAARQRIVEQLKQVVTDEPDEPRVVPFHPSKGQEQGRPMQQGQPREQGQPRQRAWRFALPLAAALAVVFSFLIYQRAVEQAPALALPAYAAQFQGASQALRGPEDAGSRAANEVARIAVGNTVQVILTPERPLDGAIEGRAFLSRAGGWQALTPDTITVSSEGAVRFAAVVGQQMELTREPKTLLLMIGQASVLPSPEVAASTVDADDGGELNPEDQPWRSFQWILTLDDAP